MLSTSILSCHLLDRRNDADVAMNETINKSFARLFARRGLSYDRLRVLAEVAEAGSIAKAAGSNATRQSQYSRQLKELEEFCGVELTEHRGRNLCVTQSGQDLAALARSHFLALDDFLASTRNQLSTIRIGAGDSLVQWLLTRRLNPASPVTSSFSIQVHNLTSTEIVQRVREFSLDFGLISSDRPHKGLDHKKLGTVAFALYVPKSLSKGILSASDYLRSHQAFALIEESGKTTQRIHMVLRKGDYRPKGELVCESFPEALSAVRSGRYAAVLPSLVDGTSEVAETVRFDDAGLKAIRKDVIIIWNPKLLRVRPFAQKLIGELVKVLEL